MHLVNQSVWFEFEGQGHHVFRQLQYWQNKRILGWENGLCSKVGSAVQDIEFY